MPLFYTGKGDRGKSSIGKKKIAKNHPALITLGDLDELNSLLGVVKAGSNQKELKKKIETVQQNLFIIQANVAWILYPKFRTPEFVEQKVRAMEREIDAMENSINPKRGFVVAGSSMASAWLDYVRAVARRAERSMYVFSKKKNSSLVVSLAYLNRLSSYLYALARFEAKRSKTKESKPTYK